MANENLNQREATIYGVPVAEWTKMEPWEQRVIASTFRLQNSDPLHALDALNETVKEAIIFRRVTADYEQTSSGELGGDPKKIG